MTTSAMPRIRKKATRPIAAPNSTPPPASMAKRRAASMSVRSACPVAAANTMVKTTTPTPSLNRLSVAIVAWIDGGSQASLRMAMTATGSVGLIRAPKTKHQTSGRSGPVRSSSSFSPNPTTSVDSTVPNEARARIAHRPCRMSRQSMWKAPANSRNDSMPSSSVVLKSSRSTKDLAKWCSCSPGARREMTMIAAEASAPRIVSPIADGSLMKRALIELKIAVITTTIAAASKGERSKPVSVASDPGGRKRSSSLGWHRAKDAIQPPTGCLPLDRTTRARAKPC